ncbi:MAG TPA: hypothetical protein VGE15_00020 [Sphingobacteriaceae bacterium]
MELELVVSERIPIYPFESHPEAYNLSQPLQMLHHSVIGQSSISVSRFLTSEKQLEVNDELIV